MIVNPAVKIFDTHAHYNLEPLWVEWENFWQEAQAMGVRKTLVAGADFESSKKAIGLAQAEDQMWATVGLHPSFFLEKNFLNLLSDDCDQNNNFEISTKEADFILNYISQQLPLLIDQQKQEKKVIAIGEIGLDYFRIKDRPDFDLIRKIQWQLLEWQLEWAQNSALTTVFHVRDEDSQAYEEILEILRRKSFSAPIILHCLSGNESYVRTASDLGVYFSLAGNITYRNAANLRELIKLIPANKLLIETDAPFLPPQSHRGQLCRPAYIAETAAFLQYDYGVDLCQVYENSHRALQLI